MWPMIGGLISGGASLLGNMFSANTSAANTQQQIAAQQGMLTQSENFNAAQADKAMQFSANQAQIQQGFEEQMSGTAYRRAVMDMKMAGLNPAMMFGGGSAASTPAVASPTGVSASVGTPSVPMPQTQSAFGQLGDVVGKAVNSAIAVKTFDKMSEEIANIRADASLRAAQRDTEAQKPWLVGEQAMLTEAQREAAKARLPAAQLEGTTAKDVLTNTPAWIRESMDVGNWVGQKMSGVLSPILNSATKLNQLGVWE